LIYRKATDDFEDGTTSDQTGLLLGIIEGIQYDSNSVKLGPGDCVLLMTDGITESQNKDDEEFHMEGVISALRTGPMTPRAMVDRVVAAVHQHAIGRKPHDDVTIVAFGRTASVTTELPAKSSQP
jgi:phosphoserine phosphatase RsbU/P